MAFSIVSRSVLRTSREILDRNVVAAMSLLHGNLEIDFSRSTLMSQRFKTTHTTTLTPNTYSKLLQTGVGTDALLQTIRQFSKKPATASSKQEADSDSDSDSDEEIKQKRDVKFQRGDSEFWRRKMRTFHRILDVNRDGVISFDDFSLLAKRFTDLGHLTPETSAEFLEVMKQTWEEQFGEITPYNLVTAEQMLTDFHHRLNDDKMAKRIGRFLPYLFKAVDYDHTGHLDIEQYKLFFRCLGLTDEDAAISFAVIDENGDGQLSLKEFVHLGRQFFLTENETKISKMFWGPLLDH